MSYNRTSPMSVEFHDWLDQCPVPWNRLGATDEDATYVFDKDGD